jgi:TP901 family phage tail tape measure protein
MALVRIGADDRGYRQSLRGTEKATQAWATRIKGHLSRAFKAGFGGLGNVAGMAGIASFGAIAREVKVFNDRLVRLQISSGQSRGAMLKFGDTLHRTAVATGVSADILLGGAEKYQELTGRFSEFEASLQTFAMVASATGADMSDLSEAAAALSDNLNVKPDEFLKVFDILANQGKQGAVELRNLAQEFTGLTSGFARFGTVGVKGANQLGAWLQVLRKGAPTASEAATQLQSLMSELQNPMNVKLLKKRGVRVYANEKTGELRDLSAIVADIHKKLKPQDIAKIFGRMESRKALITHKDNVDMFVKLQDEAQHFGTIQKDSAIWQESAGARLAKAQAQFKDAFNQALIKNMDAIVHAFEAMVKALSWIADHPEALLAIAALWKGGGVAGSLGGIASFYGAGAGAGAGGVAGAAGGARGPAGAAARGLNIAGGIGGAMQGAGVGLAVAATLGQDMSTFSKGTLVAMHAMAGLPGPIGAVGLAASLLSDGLLAAAAAANESIDAEHKRIVEQKYGDQTSRQNADILLGTKKWGWKRDAKGVNQWALQDVESGATDAEKRRAAREEMREVFESGAGLNIGDRLGVDRTKIDEVIAKNHPEFTPHERARKKASMLAAASLLNAGDLTGENLTARQDFLHSMGIGKGSQPAAPLFAAPSADTPFFEAHGNGQPSYAKQVIELVVKPAPGFDFLQFIRNQIGGRRG